MEIERTQTLRGDGYDYFPADGSRETSFGRLPKEFTVGAEDIEYDNVVFFDANADKVQELWEQGYRKFKLEKGRLRTNKWVRDNEDVVESQEIVCKQFKALRAGKVNAAKTQKPKATPSAL